MSDDSTVRCAACGRDVPVAAYCGYCGADLTADNDDGRGRLRIREYAAEPREHLLHFSPASTLFPQLPIRSRRPLWRGLLTLVVVLVVFAVAGWQAPLIAACVLGFPLLLLVYLNQIGARQDLSTRWLLVTAGVGIALGVVWGLVGGKIISDGSDVGLDTGLSLGSILVQGLMVPVAGALLMLVPALLVRAARSGQRESMDGFAIGALGATCYTAASTMARLAPQLATGPLTDEQPLSATLVEAGIRGLAMPVTAAAAGGFVGIALWFSRRLDGAHHDRGPAVMAVVPAVLLTMLLYAAMGMSELLPIPDDIHLILHLLISALALLALRIAVQMALLHEGHGDVTPAGPVLCANCDHIVPDMPFCPSCGVATAAASRYSREARRAAVVRAGETGAQARPRPGYALPAGSYAAAPLRRLASWRVAATVGGVVGVAAASAFALSVVITPTGTVYNCPPDCGRPPMGVPVAANPRFFASNGQFSVSYPGPGTSYRADMDPNGVVLDYTAGDKGTMELFGQDAMGRSPKQIVDELLKRSYPDAVIKYEIPNASVGYQLGYGVAADVYPQDPDSRFTRLRVIVLSAVKNDYALVASAVGPFRRFSREFGSGHPSGANLELALDMGKYVNSFMWRGDPPR